MLDPRQLPSARVSRSLRLFPFLLTCLILAFAVAACEEDTGEQRPGGSSSDALSEAAPQDVVPETSAPEPTPEPIPEVTAEPVEIVPDLPPEQSAPEPEFFVFEKAPWLLNPIGDGMTVAWQSDVQLVSPMVEVEGLFSDGASEARLFFGRSGPMNMVPPEVPGVSVLPVAAPSGFQNRVAVEGLAAGEVYAYRVRNADGDFAADFRAAPAAEQSYRVAAYGDSRSDHESHQRVMTAMAAEAPDLVLHSGDMVAMSNEETWQTFFDITSSVTSFAPMMGAIGNHEADMLRAWVLELLNPPTGFEDGTNASFVYGSAYIIVITYLRDPTRPGFLEWLEAELVKAQAYPYRFLVSHGPMHTFSNHAPWVAGTEHVEPLLQAYGVQAAFAGHNHCYEHFLVGDLHHFTVGGGGAPLYGISQHPIPGEEQWLVSEGKFFHFMMLEITPEAATATVRRVTPDGVEDFETISLAPAF